MSPSTATSVCSPLPSRGSRLSPVPHAHRYYGFVRLLPAHPGRLRSPSTARYLTVECPFVPLASAFDQPGPGPLRSGAPYLLHAGGDGRSPRFLENPCESVPRARDSGGSQRPRRIGRPDAVFRQANGVDIRHGIRFRSCTLAARFLAAFSELHPRGPLPRCLRFTPASRPTRGKARYRPARYGFGRAGLSPAGLFREVSVSSCRLPPLPGLAWRDNPYYSPAGVGLAVRLGAWRRPRR